MSIEIQMLSSQDDNFWLDMEKLLAWESVSDEQVFNTVSEILSNVRTQGDSAVIEYTTRFDNLHVSDMSDLEMPATALKTAYEGLPEDQKNALGIAVERIERYAQKQKMSSWEYAEEDGTILGQKITPLDRAGLYVPGGKAAYPSSVLMNAIPAKVAGVKELIMVVPTPNGQVNDLV
ncbi:MAG: histidinol dehydrogenase, partial [Gammaproteobacteria bacterium]